MAYGVWSAYGVTKDVILATSWRILLEHRPPSRSRDTEDLQFSRLRGAHETTVTRRSISASYLARCTGHTGVGYLSLELCMQLKLFSDG